MGEMALKLPDVGEGIAEAELVEWHVKVGDLVREDTLLAAVMTDKATVEIPSPIEGEITWLGAKAGDLITVGSDLVHIRIPGDDRASAAKGAEEPPKAKARAAAIARLTLPAKPPAAEESEPPPAETRPRAIAPSQLVQGSPPRLAAGALRGEGSKPLASPSVRLRAREAGVNLRQVPGNGPAGRITHEELDAYFAQGPGTARVPAFQVRTAVE